MVDVEGEDSGVVTEEEPEEDLVTASKDVDTTILFIEPAHNPLNTLGRKISRKPGKQVLLLLLKEKIKKYLL